MHNEINVRTDGLEMATEQEPQDFFQSHFKNVKIFQDDCLGSGAYGVVCKAECDELPCAAKLLHQTFVAMGHSWVTDKFLQECAFLSSIKHPNIVQFLGVHSDPKSNQPVLLMELMDESLTHFLESFGPLCKVPLHIQVDICHDVVLALHYLHSNGIIHRDLSSNNVLLIAGKRAKITDFGMSKLTTTTSVMLSSYTQVPGCPVYMPPEAWLSPPIYTETLDIFSFGVLVLQIITKNAPKPGTPEVLLSDKRSPTGFLKLPVPETDRRSSDIELVSSEHPLRAAMLKCLRDRGDERPSSEELCRWISGIKDSNGYKESCKDEHGTKTAVESVNGKEEERGESETDTLISSLKQLVEEKKDEVKQLQDKVSDLQITVKDLQGELSSKDSEIEQLKEKLKLKEKPATAAQPRPDGMDVVILTGFSPEVLSIIAHDRDISVYRLKYDLETGSVTFLVNKNSEDVSQNIRVFLLIYQHVFNSGQLRIEYISIPTSYPIHLLQKSFKWCRMDHSKSSFEHIEQAKMIKVVSQTPEQLLQSSQQMSDHLNLTLTLPFKQKLSVKYGDITNEDVSIIVSAASPDLTHRWGVAAAINVASGLEVQKQTEEHIKKYGHVLPGYIACTRAGGTLKCEWIIHAVGTSGIFRGDKSPSQKLAADIDHTMKQLVTRVLQKAEALRATSIAIPAISTGSMGLDCKIAASAIIEGITSYKFQPESVIRDIRIVLIKEDIFNTFAETLIDRSSLFTSPPPTHSFGRLAIKSSTSSTSASSSTSKNAITANPYTDHAPSSCKHQ